MDKNEQQRLKRLRLPEPYVWPRETARAVERRTVELTAFLRMKCLRILSDLDDDLAFYTPCLDVGHSVFGRFEWKDPIHNWPNSPRLDKRSDLARQPAARTWTRTSSSRSSGSGFSPGRPRPFFHSASTINAFMSQAAVPFEPRCAPGQRAQNFEATACGAREHRLYTGVSG